MASWIRVCISRDVRVTWFIKASSKSKACTDAEYMTTICKSVCEIGLKCKTMHKPDEYTTKQDLQQLMCVYRDIITEFALNYNANEKV